MRVVVALGGNALLRRGQPLTAENQRANARAACVALAPVALEHELVISHGNGPQVGLLALQGSAYTAVDTYPLDVLGAQTEGMIGYIIEQELGNRLPPERHLATLLTMIEVDADDPAFSDPTKPIGPVYAVEEAQRLGKEKGWTFKPDGDGYRRVVPSPLPKRIFEIEAIKTLLEQAVVICAGGGGIPTRYLDEDVPAGRRLVGVEGVIDKDLASALLAIDIEADAARDRHGRRRGLRRLGHARAAADQPRDPGRARRGRVRRGLDGPEGARRLRVRRAHGQAGRDRLDQRHAGARARGGRHGGRARRGRNRNRRTPLGRRARHGHDTGPHRPPPGLRRGAALVRALRAEVAEALGVDTGRGLDPAEAAARLDQYGPNRFAEAQPEPRWRAFVRQYRDLMQIVLLVAGILSLYPLKELGTGLMLLFLTVFNAVLGLHQEGKAAEAVSALQKMMIVKARVRRGGELLAARRPRSSCRATSSRSRRATSSRPTGGCSRRRRSRSTSRR